MTRMKTDAELRRIIKRIAERNNIGLKSLTRNIQGTVDVELDDCNNLFYEDRPALEREIRSIKGVVINDIFIEGVPHT